MHSPACSRIQRIVLIRLSSWIRLIERFHRLLVAVLTNQGRWRLQALGLDNPVEMRGIQVQLRIVLRELQALREQKTLTTSGELGGRHIRVDVDELDVPEDDVVTFPVRGPVICGEIFLRAFVPGMTVVPFGDAVVPLPALSELLLDLVLAPSVVLGGEFSRGEQLHLCKHCASGTIPQEADNHLDDVEPIWEEDANLTHADVNAKRWLNVGGRSVFLENGERAASRV